MNIFPDTRVKNVMIDEDNLSVEIMDGRKIIVPLVWYPRLLNAKIEQLKKWEICGGGYGIHWDEIDEDISIEGLLRGSPSPDFQKNSVSKI